MIGLILAATLSASPAPSGRAGSVSRWTPAPGPRSTRGARIAAAQLTGSARSKRQIIAGPLAGLLHDDDTWYLSGVLAAEPGQPFDPDEIQWAIETIRRSRPLRNPIAVAAAGNSSVLVTPTVRPLSARVIIPGSVNYFYDRAGERVATALRALGATVELTTLADSAGAST